MNRDVHLPFAWIRDAGVLMCAPAVDRAARVVIGLLWLASTAFLAAHHAVWRDEMRALSLALQGDTTIDMLRAVHGEGHPALWYLLLRGAHAVVATTRVLPVVAFAVSAAAVAVLLRWSPLRWPVVALVALSNFAVFEYTVSARNYGISMLVLFVLAAGYRRWRLRGWAIGGLLFLLANTNAHSVLLAACFLGFWAVDLLSDGSGRRRAATVRTLAVGTALTGAGIAACVATIYPPFNDATAAVRAHVPAGAVVQAVLEPAFGFWQMVGDPWRASLLGGIFSDWDILLAFMSIAMFASVLGLARVPAAALAALASLVGFSVFFAAVYPGQYRHQALWLAFMVALYWICAARPDAPAARGGGAVLGAAVAVGRAAFVLLLFVQLPATIDLVRSSGPGALPLSRSADFARFLAGRPELAGATLLADPDYLLEPMPYYLDNPTYLLREHRFGRVVVFTRHAQLDLSLDEVLQRARALQATTRRPVVILMGVPLDRVTRPVVVHEGYDWTLRLDPAQVDRFRRATALIDRERGALSDEEFDVYLLSPAPGASASLP